MGRWSEQPPPDEAFASSEAFLADTMSFYQWLQFVLLDRIRSIIAGNGRFPSSSSVGAYAVRELDTESAEADSLIRLLCEFDEVIERGGA